jgi:hypothetical protein
MNNNKENNKKEEKVKAATKDQMNQLHSLIANTLANIIKAEVNKKDEGNPLQAIDKAIRFMKDNGITYMPEANTDDDGLDSLDEALANVLPFPVRRNGTTC